MTVRLVLAAALVALGAAARAGDGSDAPPAHRIALDPLRATDLPEGFREAVEDQLCAAIGAASKAEDVVCPSDVAAAALLAKQGAMFGECLPDECLRRVDAMRRADRRVTASLAQGERRLVLLLEVSEGEGHGRRVVENLPEELDALLARIPGVVKKLLPER